MNKSPERIKARRIAILESIKRRLSYPCSDHYKKRKVEELAYLSRKWGISV